MQRATYLSLYLLTAAPLVVSAADSPEVINKYPACEYEVLDTVEASKIVNFDKISTIPRLKQDTFNHLVGELREDAQRAGAHQIALIDKTLVRTVKDYGKVTLAAEFISDCKGEDNGEGDYTPYSANGVVQIGLASTTTFSHSMTLDLNKRDVAQPALGDDHRVSPQSGLYGLALGAGKQQMLDKFGTPTFEFVVSDKVQLFAYGRTHWLTFVDGALTKARYDSDLFTNTLLNYLPFDERFDDRQWQATSTLKKSATLEPERAQQLNTTLRSDNALVKVKTETQLVNNQKDNVVRVTGFELLKQPVQTPDGFEPGLTDNGILSYIAGRLNQGDSELLLDALPYPERGRSRPTSDGQYHLYNAYTLIESVGNSVSEVHVNPDFMASVETSEADWQFDDFYFGQSEDEALAAAGDNAFYFDHMIEVDKDNYTAKIVLERDGDQYRVYSMEINVY